jgi:uncharacterized repeat protein (TIGR01451 family)
MANIPLTPVACLPGSISLARPTVCGAGVGSIIPSACFVAPPVCCINIENVVVTPNPVPANSNFTVDADFRNCGDQPLLAGSATLTGLPVGVTILGLGASVTWPGIPTIGFVQRQWTLANNATNAQTTNMTITANDDCATGGPVTDVDIAPVTVIAGVSALHANLITTKSLTSADNQPVGTAVQFVIDVFNQGPDAANGSTIVDSAPSCFTFQTQTLLGFGGATITGTYPNWTVTNFPVGSTARVTLDGVSNAAGACLNSVTATVPSGTVEDDPSSNTATATFTATLEADLQVQKTTSTASVLVGNSGTFTVTATNNGPAAANGGTVQDTLPVFQLTYTGPFNVAYGGGAAGQATVTQAALSSGLIIPTWPVGGTVVITIPFTGANDGDVQNTAAVAPPSGVVDPTPGNNSATVDISITSPPVRTVEITTSKNGNDPSVGASQTFTNTHTNVGPDVADGLTVIEVPSTGYGTHWGLGFVPINVTYTGGATGPSSLTRAQLLAGFTVTTWPVGAQVIVTYPVGGINGGAPASVNCAGVRTVPGITLVNTTDSCFPFNVIGAQNCACTATYDVTPTDIFIGQSFTATYTLPTSANCCLTTEFRVIRYPTFADAQAHTNGVDTIQGSQLPCTTLGGSGNFPFTPGSTGFERYYIKVINNGLPTAQECNITDSNQVFGNAPLPTVGVVALSGNWPAHNIS